MHPPRRAPSGKRAAAGSQGVGLGAWEAGLRPGTWGLLALVQVSPWPPPFSGMWERVASQDSSSPPCCCPLLGQGSRTSVPPGNGVSLSWTHRLYRDTLPWILEVSGS